MSNVDVELLFGVSGGGKLSGASGKEIQSKLQELVKNLEAKNIPKIKLFFDEKALNKELEKIKKKIQTSLAININQPAIKQGYSIDNNKKELDEYNKLSAEIKKTADSFDKLNKSKKRGIEYSLEKGQIRPLNEYSDAVMLNVKNLKYKLNLLHQIKMAEARNADNIQQQLEKEKSSYGKLLSNIDDYIQRTTARTETGKTLLNSLQDAVRTEPIPQEDLDKLTPIQQLELYKKKLTELSNQYNFTKGQMAALGETTQTVWQRFTKALGNKFFSAISASLIAFGTRAIAQVYQNIVKIDTAVTNLNITARLTKNQFNTFFSDATQSAKKLGVEIDKLIDSVTEFVRLGYSLKDSQIFAELTTMYSNVTGDSVSDATTYMTSIIKAYNIAAEDAELILDKIITVGNNYAISPGELGEAMSDAGSALAANGNTIEEAMGILTAANGTIQDINKAATAVRTISARISSSTLELEELGEDTTNVMATADLDEKMRAIGVAITDSNGELRSTYDILNDLSKVWETLTSTERAAVTEMLAGNRQQNAFYSIMSNWEDATGAVSDCDSAMGTLSSSYDIYLDSIDGKVSQLTATWQEFSANLLDSEIVKFLIDVLKVIADILSGIISFGDGIGGKMAVITAAVMLLSSVITKIQPKLKDFFTNFKGGISSIGNTIKTSAPLLIFSLLLTLLTTTEQKWTKWVALIIAGITLIGITVTVIIKGIDATIKAFQASNPLGWILLIIGAVVSGVMALVELLKKPSFEDLKEAAKEAKDAWNEAKNAVDEVSNKLTEIEEKIAEINSKETLTLVDQAQLDALEHQKRILEQELELKKQEEEIAKRNAFDAAAEAYDKYKSEYVHSGWDRFWNGGSYDDTYEQRFDRLAQNGAAYKQLFEGYEQMYASGELDKETYDFIVKLWKEQQAKDEEFMTNYLAELGGLVSGFDYYTGDNLEDWQKEINSYLDEYYSALDKFTMYQGDPSSVWNSVFSRVKYKDAHDALKELANDFKLSGQEIDNLASKNKNVAEFLAYIEEIGLYSKDSEDSVSALIEQIKQLADVAPTVAKKGYIDIVKNSSDQYEFITEALDDMKELGILSGDTLKTMQEEFPSVMELLLGSGNLETSDDGYKLTNGAINTFFDSIRDSYDKAYKEAEEYYNKVYEANQKYGTYSKELEEALTNKNIAEENKKNVEVAINILERSDLLEKYQEMMEGHSDTLEDELDKYKDIIDIRKELLESYADEIEKQKELEKRQSNVADLKTKLSLAQLDNSAAGQAEVRRLQAELEEAEEELSSYTLEQAISELTEQLDAEHKEYESWIETQTDAITKAIEDAANMSTDQLRKALGDNSIGNIPEHHTGGFVGNIKPLKSNEEFAKLLNGELVVTPIQMSNFMNRTLPSLTGGASSINYNSPLMVVQCESITKDSLPKLEDIINKAVLKVKSEINNTFSRTGRKKYIEKFTI